MSVYDEARLDRWMDAPDEGEELPTAAEIAGSAGDLAGFINAYSSGRIRTGASLLTRPLCTKRPDERLSACVLEADHEGGCVFVRLTHGRHGGAYYRIPAGSPTPVQVHEIRTRYSEPTRNELAEEWAWLGLFNPDHPALKELTP